MDVEELSLWMSVPFRVADEYSEIADDVQQTWAKYGEEAPGIIRRALGYLPFTQPKSWLPLHVNPMVNALVTGMAGAGIGYGLGSVGEWLLPDRWERGKLRKSLALLGGGLGASPGLLMAAVNMHNNQSPFERGGWEPGGTSQQEVANMFARNSRTRMGWKVPNETDDFAAPAVDLPNTTPPPKPPGGITDTQFPYDNLPKYASDDWNSSAGALSVGFDPRELQQLIWNNQAVAGPLSPPQQAALAGIVTGAANLPGKPAHGWVTPVDVARLAAGMGGGWMSGLLAGKILGAVAGMPDDTQNTLTNVGMTAGLLREVIPLVFGG